MSSIDYYFGLDVEVNEADTHYSEQLIRMEYMSSAPMQPVIVVHKFITLFLFMPYFSRCFCKPANQLDKSSCIERRTVVVPRIFVEIKIMCDIGQIIQVSSYI